MKEFEIAQQMKEFEIAQPASISFTICGLCNDPLNCKIQKYRNKN